MKSNNSRTKCRVQDRPSSVITGIVFVVFGILGIAFSVAWMFPQTIALPVQFPDEHDFRFFNGAMAAYTVATLALLVMGVFIVRNHKKPDSTGALKVLQLVSLVSLGICILLMVKSPLVYNLFLGMGLVPVGMAVSAYTCAHGFPRISGNVTWNSLLTGIVVAVLPILIFTGYTMYSYLDYAMQNDKYAVATDFKEFKAECIDGTQINQSFFKEHKLTMVNCWETICGPCIREMPDLEKIYREKNGDDFTIVGICADCISGGKINESVLSDAKEIVGAGITYPIVIPSPELEKGILSEISAFPTTFFIDSNGDVVKTVLGSNEKKDWEAIIKECQQQVDNR